MYRYAMESLLKWKDRDDRHPLVVRGARQVGKSWLIRSFGADHFDNVVELNLERKPELETLFKSNDPQETLRLLQLQTGATITPGRTLLFLDEIQAAPSVFASLRYFLEDLPALHVIAAGSLLEFAMSDGNWSVPVGRIEYLHLGPMQFGEFLLAAGETHLARFLAEWKIRDEIAAPIHNRLMDLFRVFLVVGGMPASVNAWANGKSLSRSGEVLESIFATFVDDFGKYGQKVRRDRIEVVFKSLPGMVGGRFKYSTVSRDERSSELARALDLLTRARVAFKVRHSPANGIPLGYQASDSVFKVLFLDVGLVNAALGLSLLDYDLAEDVMTVHSGSTCEQAVGQHLLHSMSMFSEPDLYFWSREKANSAAEVDYVISIGQRVIPVEVKAGTTGRLKSLHMFLREHELDFGVRLNADVPSMLDSHTSIANGKNVPFRLLSLPLYMAGEVRRICATVPA